MDIVSIVVGALVVDTLTSFILLTTARGGKRVREWYRTFRIGAYTMDVLSLIIGTSVVVRLLPNATLWQQMALGVGIQMVHDVSFGLLVANTVATSPVLTLFKRYGEEMKQSILWADALMMVSTLLGAHLVAKIPRSDGLVIAFISAYVGLLVTYSY